MDIKASNYYVTIFLFFNPHMQSLILGLQEQIQFLFLIQERQKSGK